MLEWYVQVPVSQLLELQNIVGEFHKLQAENKHITARMDALHSTLYKLMEQVQILRKECQPKR